MQYVEETWHEYLEKSTNVEIEHLYFFLVLVYILLKISLV